VSESRFESYKFESKEVEKRVKLCELRSRSLSLSGDDLACVL